MQEHDNNLPNSKISLVGKNKYQVLSIRAITFAPIHRNHDHFDTKKEYEEYYVYMNLLPAYLSPSISSRSLPPFPNPHIYTPSLIFCNLFSTTCHTCMSTIISISCLATYFILGEFAALTFMNLINFIVCSLSMLLY